MGHQETYRQNEAYAEFLAGWDENFYGKYADTLRPEKPGGLVLPQDVEREWDELEWNFTRIKHPNRKAAVELKKWFDRVRLLHQKIGKRIAADFNRERTKLLTATLEKLAEERLELVLMAQEERRQAAIKADLEQSRKETQAYLEKLMAAAPKKAGAQ